MPDFMNATPAALLPVVHNQKGYYNTPFRLETTTMRSAKSLFTLVNSMK